METIKVTYNSIVRRFNIANSTTWAELESKLRTLYKIPTTSSLTVSYTDEDGDVITVSSDLELEEVLVQQSSGRPIKLVLNTVDDIGSDSENWVLENGNNESEHGIENKLSSERVDDGNNLNLVEDSSSQSEEQQTTERKEENDQSRPPSYYQHVSFVDEEEEESEDTPLLQREKEKEGSEQQQQHHQQRQQQPEPERTKDTKTQTNENDNSDDDDDDDDGIIFIISYPWARPTFFGPGFRFFGGPRFGSFDRPCFNSGSFGHRGSYYNPYVYGRPQCYGSAFFNGCDGRFSSRQCNPNSCGPKSNACRRNSKQQSAEASTSASAQNRCNKNDYTSRPSCNRNFNLFNPYGNQTQLTQEQLDNKLSTLHSMGFDSSNDTLYEDLLKRYNGNLERVIELLLRNQQVNEHYDNGKQKGIVINEEKARSNYDSEKNVETKHDDGEKSKPYVL